MVMQRRRIPVLDSFFDRVSLLLWPRLKAVIVANIRSVRGANPRKLGTVDLSKHYVSKRYAEFAVSVLSLQSGGADGGVGGGGDGMLTQDLLQLRTDVTSLLEKMAQLLTTNKDRAVFLINNYDQILSTFQERRLVCDETQRFEELLLRQREIFAEEEIRLSFPRMVSFVIQTEHALQGVDSGDVRSALSLDEILVESLVKEFSANWRVGVQQINGWFSFHDLYLLC